jgi:hypothetical protein
MMKSHALHAALLGLSFTCAAAGCAQAPPDGEPLAEASSDLRVSSWSFFGEAPNESWTSAQVATINGTTIMVQSASCISAPA